MIDEFIARKILNKLMKSLSIYFMRRMVCNQMNTKKADLIADLHSNIDGINVYNSFRVIYKSNEIDAQINKNDWRMLSNYEYVAIARNAADIFSVNSAFPLLQIHTVP